MAFSVSKVPRRTTSKRPNLHILQYYGKINTTAILFSQTTILAKNMLKLTVAGWEHSQGTLEIQLFFDLLLFNQGGPLRDILVEPLC